jgi:hypothetical protein
MKINNNAIISKTQNFVASDIDGQAVMMNIENSKYYGMDETGTRIWELIDVRPSFGQIIDTLLSEYHVDKPTCENDTALFLEKLLKSKLVSIE